MTEKSTVVELTNFDDRDQAIFDQRLAGRSVRQIARQFRLSMRHVDDIIEAHITPETLETKAQSFGIELARLEVFQRAIFDKVLEGNVSAVMASVKICERRAAMRGSDAAIRIDAVQVLAEATPSTTTDKIQRVLDEIAALPRPEQKPPDIEQPAKPDIEQEE